jgi:hypothetical protein
MHVAELFAGEGELVCSAEGADEAEALRYLDWAVERYATGCRRLDRVAAAAVHRKPRCVRCTRLWMSARESLAPTKADRVEPLTMFLMPWSPCSRRVTPSR